MRKSFVISDDRDLRYHRSIESNHRRAEQCYLGRCRLA
jgi:hypothetical protein